MTNKKTFRHLIGVGTMALAIGAMSGGAARADDAKPADAKPANWLDAVKLGGQLDVGITGNPDSNNDHRNFGRLYDDHENQLMLNQLLLTAQRPIDSTKPVYDLGFKLQGMYGSDARYTHFLHEFDLATTRVNQFDLVEANLQLHAPWFTDGGVDLKAGQYPTPLGNEVIDPSGNTFYSHSYIYNFGLPVKHTGILATWHALPILDVWTGFDWGNLTSPFADNNNAEAGILGVGLNLLGGNLTILGLSHFGPENPNGSVDLNGNPIRADRKYRYYNDIVTTWKVTDKWTLVNEANWVHDDGLSANGYGMAQYASYALDDIFTLSARAEVWRDAQGAFVAQFGNNTDAARLLGLPSSQIPNLSSRTVGGGKTTYGELTLGVQIKPPVPSFITGTVIRPEIRVDRALSTDNSSSSSTATPFNDSKDKTMYTAAVDVVIPF
ncbi:MAG TPA: outer membrane beta-barrel protein [Candidatus Cybelea sp.]|nr:outer membrane beta-barrel protein [Candidatus Cybelea sp.]